MPVLLAAVALIAAVAALIYRFWRALIGAPGTFGRWRRERRRRKGYVALTQGMVAVAAGDPDEARRQARRADVLLNEPPLTMLLSAQAAQLNGDENAAGRYFTQMLERSETEFLGLRGLLIQAMRKGEHGRAIELARRARALRPKTPWVLTTLFELETRSGDWPAAADTLGRAQRAGALPAPQARRHEAAVLVEMSRAAGRRRARARCAAPRRTGASRRCRSSGRGDLARRKLYRRRQAARRRSGSSSRNGRARPIPTCSPPTAARGPWPSRCNGSSRSSGWCACRRCIARA